MALAGEQNQKRIPESLWHRVLRPVSYLSFLCSMTLNRMEPWNTSHAKFQYLVCVASQNDVSQRSQAICHVEIIYVEQNYVQNICLYSPSKYALALYRRSMRPKCCILQSPSSHSPQSLLVAAKKQAIGCLWVNGALQYPRWDFPLFLGSRSGQESKGLGVKYAPSSEAYISGLEWIVYKSFIKSHWGRLILQENACRGAQGCR